MKTLQCLPEREEFNEFVKRFLLILDSLDNCEVLRENLDEELKYKILHLRKRIIGHAYEETPFRVVFCGIFSAGKSSLINKLLKTDYKLPTGINPVTKIVTRIRYGKEIQCSCYCNGKWEKLDRYHSGRIIKGEEVLPNGCSEVMLEMPAEILKKNIEFIDTPGFDDTDKVLGIISRRAIESADFAVLCCSALVLGKITERELIKELEKTIGNFCLAVTRIDCLNTEEEYEAVIQRAQWLMAGRGNAAKVLCAESRYFPIICAEKYAALNGFDLYLSKIFDESDIRNRILISADMLNMISMESDLEHLVDSTINKVYAKHLERFENIKKEIREKVDHEVLEIQLDANLVEDKLQKIDELEERLKLYITEENWTLDYIKMTKQITELFFADKFFKLKRTHKSVQIISARQLIEAVFANLSFPNYKFIRIKATSGEKNSMTAIGAGIGTIVAPGLGTVIGGSIGAFIGSWDKGRINESVPNTMKYVSSVVVPIIKLRFRRAVSEGIAYGWNLSEEEEWNIQTGYESTLTQLRQVANSFQEFSEYNNWKCE